MLPGFLWLFLTNTKSAKGANVGDNYIEGTGVKVAYTRNTNAEDA